MSRVRHRGDVTAAPRVQDVLRAFAPPLPREPERAPSAGMSAVLIPVFDGGAGGPLLLFTRRSATLRRHAGELSFPGGRIDAADAHPLAAALREAEEEVGLSPRDVRVLGHLADTTTYYGVVISAYVGLASGAPPREARSKDEVEELLPVPVGWLLDPMRYEARAHVETPDRRVHYWDLGHSTLWGITGEITARFLSRVWGWRPPSEARIIREISDFRPRV